MSCYCFGTKYLLAPADCKGMLIAFHSKLNLIRVACKCPTGDQYQFYLNLFNYSIIYLLTLFCIINLNLQSKQYLKLLNKCPVKSTIFASEIKCKYFEIVLFLLFKQFFNAPLIWNVWLLCYNQKRKKTFHDDALLTDLNVEISKLSYNLRC